MTRSSRVVTDVVKLSTTSRPLDRDELASVRKGEKKGLTGYDNFGSCKRNLSILRRELGLRCSSGRAMAATTTRKVLPIELVLSFLRTACSALALFFYS